MEGEQLVKSQGEESVETDWNYHYILLCAKQWLTKKQKL